MKNKTNRRILAYTVVVLFNLTAVFSACIAWFSAVRKVDQTGEGFEVVNYNGLVKGISLYSLDNDTENTYNLIL